METKVSKKANIIIATFTKREDTMYNYLIELYKNTIDKIEGCTKEVEVFENDKPIYRQTIKAQTEAEFRLKYIFQCLDLKANYDYENRILSIKSNIYGEDK